MGSRSRSFGQAGFGETIAALADQPRVLWLGLAVRNVEVEQALERRHDIGYEADAKRSTTRPEFACSSANTSTSS